MGQNHKIKNKYHTAETIFRNGLLALYPMEEQ